MSSKTPPFILESFSFVKYNGEHKDLDPITDRQVSFKCGSLLSDVTLPLVI